MGRWVMFTWTCRAFAWAGEKILPVLQVSMFFMFQTSQRSETSNIPTYLPGLCHANGRPSSGTRFAAQTYEALVLTLAFRFLKLYTWIHRYIEYSWVADSYSYMFHFVSTLGRDPAGLWSHLWWLLACLRSCSVRIALGGRERSAMSSGCWVPGALWVPLVPLGRTNRRSCEASFFCLSPRRWRWRRVPRTSSTSLGWKKEGEMRKMKKWEKKRNEKIWRTDEMLKKYEEARVWCFFARVHILVGRWGTARHPALAGAGRWRWSGRDHWPLQWGWGVLSQGIILVVLNTFWSSSVVIRSLDHPSLSSFSRWQYLDSVDFFRLSPKWKRTRPFFIAKSQLSWFHVDCIIHLDIVWDWSLDHLRLVFLCGWGHCFLHLFAESLHCSAWSRGPNYTWKFPSQDLLPHDNFHFGVPWILWIHPGSLRQGSRDSSHLVLAGLLCSFSQTNSLCFRTQG